MDAEYVCKGYYLYTTMMACALFIKVRIISGPETTSS